MNPLGLQFFQGSAQEAVLQAQGLCVFPSGPGLATLDQDTRYREALVAADNRFVDSGFLALFWFLLSGQRLSRISGLRFLKGFFANPGNRNQKILWVHPFAEAQTRNKKFAEDMGFPAALSTHYVAPMYPATGPIEDLSLVAQIEKNSPQIIVINIGSGFQEPLGAYLKKALKSPVTIICTGAAIDLLTGAQAPIPDWADRLFLGWLFRILTTPTDQAAKMRVSPSKRYWGAWRLLWLLIKWRDRLPTA